MILNYKDYLEIYYKDPESFRPRSFFTLKDLDKQKYCQLEDECKKSNFTIDDAFKQLKRRVSSQYLTKIWKTQSDALGFCSSVFPAYKFLLPEILADDWLGIVDWHKFQRDHALHQPLTAFIVHELFYPANKGDAFFALIQKQLKELYKTDFDSYLKNYLLDLGLDSSSPFLIHNNGQSSMLWLSLLYETTYIAALFHDIGYPWHLISSLNKKLDPLECNTRPTNDEDDLFEIYQERLIFYPLNGYKKINPGKPVSWKKDMLLLIRQLLSQTHGFPGAICFLYLKDAMRSFPNVKENPISQFCVDWAAMGILMHDLVKIYWGDQSIPKNPHLRLNLQKDPLSTILTLCDVLQEFSRPKAEFSRKDEFIKLEYKMPCLSTEIKLEGTELFITFVYQDNDSMLEKRMYIKEDEKNYFDPNYGYIDISSLGLTRVNLKVELKMVY
jgi:hypothetical protein